MSDNVEDLSPISLPSKYIKDNTPKIITLLAVYHSLSLQGKAQIDYV
jgi:hypothetical protein